MVDVERIRAAEATVAEMQHVLAELQSGLQQAEELAVAANQAKVRAERFLKVALGVAAALLALILLLARKKSD